MRKLWQACKPAVVILVLSAGTIPGPARAVESLESHKTRAVLASAHSHPEPGQPQIPADAEVPGRRNPWVGALAGVGIIVTLVAGIYVYRIIRKGL